MFDFFSPISALSNISKQKAEKNISESFDYLINNFKNIARIMEDYYPLELLKLSLWEERRVTSLRSKDNFKRISSSLLPILMQSVLVPLFLHLVVLVESSRVKIGIDLRLSVMTL